jgi:hypothetical protein
MLKPALPAALASLVFLSSCQPPPPVPPPNFRPNPPYAPTPVPPYGEDPAPTPQPDPEPPVTTPGTYPTATATDNPMQVISPYPPYNVIDLSDLPKPTSGQLARDPSNQKIFRVP